jgi:hypothetical protein
MELLGARCSWGCLSHLLFALPAPGRGAPPSQGAIHITRNTNKRHHHGGGRKPSPVRATQTGGWKHLTPPATDENAGHDRHVRRHHAEHPRCWMAPPRSAAWSTDKHRRSRGETTGDDGQGDDNDDQGDDDNSGSGGGKRRCPDRRGDDALAMTAAAVTTTTRATTTATTTRATGVVGSSARLRTSPPGPGQRSRAQR